MALWLLTQIDDVNWEENRAVLVRAASEEDARQLLIDLQANGYRRQGWGPASATCERITEDGPAEVIITDNKGA